MGPGDEPDVPVTARARRAGRSDGRRWSMRARLRHHREQRRHPSTRRNDPAPYRFASDAEPGDMNGQGIGGDRYVVGPDGEPVEENADSDAAAPLSE